MKKSGLTHLEQITVKNYGAFRRTWTDAFGVTQKGGIVFNQLYLTRNNDGSFDKHNQRPNEKYFCFYSEEARNNFIQNNSN